ncbi:MAG: helix-turn-helix transcriptional regulator [Solirubrobacteraceae bacterium]|nr:helix-turn-helix transcriptional regulator [Patulibacter sp.]
MTASDDRAILHLVGQVMGSVDRQDFGRHLVPALHEVLPSDWTSLNDIGPTPEDTWALVEPLPPEGLFPLFAQYSHQNPLIERYRETQDGRAYRISDLVSQEDFHAREIYTEVYRHLNVEAQIAICLPSPRGHIFGIALSRDHDYTDAERDLLNHARPFLIQAYRTALEMEKLRAGAGVLPSRTGDELEQAGLTRREQEVVLIVAKGRSNQEAADELGLSVRTVQKHLERAFRKLGVRSRTEVAVRLTSAT